MHPVVEGAVEVVATVCGNLLWELALKTRVDVVELQSVGAEVDPLGSGSEEGKGLARPETI
jgi:hypothetical protein